MKKSIFKGTLVRYERLNNSSYGNPRFMGVFENENGDFLIGKTGVNASCGYSFLNKRDDYRILSYHTTQTGNVIIDAITF